jgi:replication-associated recombination protein RarA
MTKAEIQEAKDIQAQINKAADQILSRLGKQTNGDVHVAIAALAVAMCSLARADGMLFNEMQEAVTIAFEQVNGE